MIKPERKAKCDMNHLLMRWCSGWINFLYSLCKEFINNRFGSWIGGIHGSELILCQMCLLIIPKCCILLKEALFSRIFEPFHCCKVNVFNMFVCMCVCVSVGTCACLLPISPAAPLAAAHLNLTTNKPVEGMPSWCLLSTCNWEKPEKPQNANKWSLILLGFIQSMEMHILSTSLPLHCSFPFKELILTSWKENGRKNGKKLFFPLWHDFWSTC